VTDDLDLVRAIRDGDDRAFELLYARYQPRLALYIRCMIQDDGRTEDITQDVFFSALRRIRATDAEIVLKPWLYEIAKNACIDAFRRSRRVTEVSFDAQEALTAHARGRLADSRPSPDSAVDAKVDLDNLCGAFGGLSDTHHQILVMRELEGQSYRDIGDRLGMSRPAVESTLFRARRRLEEEYDELVSGRRCIRVRGIVDAGGRAAGVRDQRRMDLHISHCQPCRRYALAAGVDLEARPARPSVAARIAALLPFPALWRRPGAADTPSQVLGTGGHATAANWSASVVSTADPVVLWGWGKAVAAAATVVVAGVGAGAAISEPQATRDLFSRAPSIAGIGGPSDAAKRDAAADRRAAAKGDRGASSARKPPRGSRAGGRDPSEKKLTEPARGRGTAAPGSGSGQSPTSRAKPRPRGSGGTAGSSAGAGGGAINGLLNGALGGGSGSGGQAGGSPNAGPPSVPDTVTTLTNNVQGALADVTGAAGAAGAAPAAVVPALVTPLAAAPRDGK